MGTLYTLYLSALVLVAIFLLFICAFHILTIYVAPYF